VRPARAGLQGTLKIRLITERNHFTLAETSKAASEKLYKAEYVGSGTFIISKPKRKKAKQRQSHLKNVRRGSRK
jgi:hypothetical protein